MWNLYCVAHKMWLTHSYFIFATLAVVIWILTSYKRMTTEIMQVKFGWRVL